MGRFESYEAANSLGDDDITLFNKDTVTHKVTFSTLINMIRSALNFNIDMNPTQNSQNLVTSGGVYNAIQTEATRAQDVEVTKADKSNTYTKVQVNNLLSPIETAVQNAITNISTVKGLTKTQSGNSVELKCKLQSETLSTLESTAMGTTANRQYAVGLDKNGNLSVNVPWTGGGSNYVAGTAINISNNTISAVLDNTITSTDVDKAATPNAVKTAYDGSMRKDGSNAESVVTFSGALTIGTRDTSTATIGLNSFTHGYRNIADGDYTHAEGYETTASGDYGSHAEGYDSTASGTSGAHAEGIHTIASGSSSHAECSNTVASGAFSHAEGDGTEADGVAAHAEGVETVSSGYGSHAEGKDTIASSNNSHAEGYCTEAKSNEGAHAEGYGYSYDSTFHRITASGKGSHAEGISISTKSVTASGEGAHAEGRATTASGSATHAEGIETIASGAGAHAEGRYTIANNVSSHAEGYGNTLHIGEVPQIPSVYVSTSCAISTNADGAHAEGYSLYDMYDDDGTPVEATGIIQANGQGSHAEGYASTSGGSAFIIASGEGSHAEGYSEGDSQIIASGEGAHAEGYAYEFQAHIASGDGSHVEGGSNIASGVASHAEGCQTNASGDYAHTEGYYTKADTRTSHTEGEYTQTQGESAHAEGHGLESIQLTETAQEDIPLDYNSDATYTICASGYGSHAEGYTWESRDGSTQEISTGVIQAVGYGAHAEGCASSDSSHIGIVLASGDGSHAEGYANGYSTIASGDGSHAEGGGTFAEGDYSHAEGYCTKASGDYSHAEGCYSVAQNDYSHAEGDNTIASGNFGSHSEGYTTIASGESAHAEGSNTVASGDYSHAGGNNVTASLVSQFVQGGYYEKFNDSTLQAVFGIQPDGKYYNTNQTIHAENGLGGTLEMNVALTLQLDKCAIYLLFVGAKDGATMVGVINTKSTSSGTPNIEELTSSSFASVGSNNTVIINNNSTDLIFHLIRII